MNRYKRTRILHLNIDSSKRLIFMSDIHSDKKLFLEALEKINFSDDDILFLIGDMIEKGDPGTNLDMMKFIMEFSRKENVYLSTGNCDEIIRFLLPPIDKELFFNFTLRRGNSIINDFAKELGWEISENMDISAFVNDIRRHYPEIFNFIDTLVDAIFINEKIVLVHAGIMDLKNISCNARDLLKLDNFLEISPHHEIPMIVGHYPTRNYRRDLFSVDPIFDWDKNIICIDGGNHVVKGGQINILILDSLDNMNFSFEAVDHYEKYVMKEDVNYNLPDKKVNIRFGHNLVEVLDTDLDFNLIKLDTGECMWVHKSFIYYRNGKSYCYDGSNSFISLKKGDTISIIKIAKPYSLIKHNGLVGLIETKYIYD